MNVYCYRKNNLNDLDIFFNKFTTRFVKRRPIMENEIYLTKEGYKALEERLAHLKSVTRVEIAEKIEIARSFGDISENSEYDAAREEEALTEQEIAEIQNSLRNAKIIQGKVDTSSVSVGNTVVLQDIKYDEELTVKIMGSFESDPTAGSISNESPMGKALLGAKKGDVVEVVTPSNVMKYKVKAIKS